MIRGLDKVLALFQRRQMTDVESSVGKAIRLVQASAKANAPVHDGTLRNSILTKVTTEHHIFKSDVVRGTCFVTAGYGAFVEFGTGPRGAANHEGISPDVAVAYTMDPWWIHESQLAPGTGETYGWFYIDTPKGRFYRCSGQPAQPYLYPALKNNEDEIKQIIASSLRGQFK